jgi:5-methylcytosine-specific restriction endonuclease McrA
MRDLLRVLNVVLTGKKREARWEFSRTLMEQKLGIIDSATSRPYVDMESSQYRRIFHELWADKKHIRGVQNKRELKRLNKLWLGRYRASKAWKKIRTQRLEKDNYLCLCGLPAKQVHHLNYIRVGGEFLEDLVSLCVSCHEHEHEVEKRGLVKIRFAQQKRLVSSIIQTW